MDKLLDPETVAMFLVFAVPGIVILYFRSQFLNGKMPGLSEGSVAYLTVSLVYHALTFPLTRQAYAMLESNWRWGLWFICILAVPAVFGVLLGLNARKGWTQRWIGRWGLSTVHPIESAWDWHFSKCEECWLIVSLKDGAKWAGYLGSNSFMSSDRGERDLYIEHVYELTDGSAPWRPVHSSVWIAHGEIQSIEFIPNGEN